MNKQSQTILVSVSCCNMFVKWLLTVPFLCVSVSGTNIRKTITWDSHTSCMTSTLKTTMWMERYTLLPSTTNDETRKTLQLLNNKYIHTYILIFICIYTHMNASSREHRVTRCIYLGIIVVVVYLSTEKKLYTTSKQNRV